MNARMPTTIAYCLAQFAPPSSEVHKIVEADLHYNELKNSGDLERRRIEKAIREERPHPWEITL